MSVRHAVVFLSLATACADAPAIEETPQEPAEVETEEEDPGIVLSENAVVLDFGDAGESRWYAVNDTVMGGVSTGVVSYTDSELVFEGTVSTDSNGGFTSVRSPDESRDLSDFSRVVVRLRTEGQPFSMILAHRPYWYQPSFRYDIEAPESEWVELEIPFEDFELYSLSSGGYPTSTGQAMEPSDRTNILHLEFMSKLFEDGDFTFEVDYVAFD